MSSFQREQTQQVSPRENQKKKIEVLQGTVTSRATHVTNVLASLCNENAGGQPEDFQPSLLWALWPAILSFQRGLAEEGGYTLYGSAPSQGLGSQTE